MTTEIIENLIEIPDNIDLTIEDRKITVIGPKGKIVKDFKHTSLSLEDYGESIRIWVINPNKRQAAQVNTLSSHIQNMMKGVVKGFEYRMKIVFIHFPMTVRVEQNLIIIENFIGERNARTAKILPDVNIEVVGDDVVLRGTDIEAVSQTAANIQQATRIRNKDLRKFLDGIYVYSKE